MLRSAPENSRSGDGADRTTSEEIGRQLAALVDGYLAEATTPDHRTQIVNLLGVLRLLMARQVKLDTELSAAKAELVECDRLINLMSETMHAGISNPQ